MLIFVDELTMDDEKISADAVWGKAKYDYYYTDYVDKDYPSKLTAKEEKLAAIEQDEALRAQKRLLSTLEDIHLHDVFETEVQEDDLIVQIENQNRTTISNSHPSSKSSRKKVKFYDGSDGHSSSENDFEDDEGDGVDSTIDNDHHQEYSVEAPKGRDYDTRERRPINVAIQKNRGLTPYKKKEYRNPRVKHKLKYKKAMSKRRRNVKEARREIHRYSGESAGIKTSTIRSIKLC